LVRGALRSIADQKVLLPDEIAQARTVVESRCHRIGDGAMRLGLRQKSPILRMPISVSNQSIEREGLRPPVAPCGNTLKSAYIDIVLEAPRL
jgi:hypothetical protein